MEYHFQKCERAPNNRWTNFRLTSGLIALGVKPDFTRIPILWRAPDVFDLTPLGALFSLLIFTSSKKSSNKQLLYYTDIFQFFKYFPNLGSIFTFLVFLTTNEPDPTSFEIVPFIKERGYTWILEHPWEGCLLWRVQRDDPWGSWYSLLLHFYVFLWMWLLIHRWLAVWIIPTFFIEEQRVIEHVDKYTEEIEPYINI